MNGRRAFRRLRAAGTLLMSMVLLASHTSAMNPRARMALDSADFMPHGYCYLWNPLILWLHVVSDSLITLSYYSTPIVLVYLVRRRRDLPFNWIFWMFGLFIVGCGTTHLMEIWTIWHASYLLSGLIKALTASVSVATAVLLIPLIPKAITWPSSEQLHAINYELRLQVVERERAEELSRQAEELARSRHAMEAQTRMLKLVLDSMGEGLIAADREGHFLIWNDSASKLMGRGPTDLPLEQWASHYDILLPDGITPYPADRLPLVRALRGESVQGEMIVQHPASEHGVFLEVTARPMKDDQGKLCGGVAAFRDITGRQAARREIQKLNQDLEARVAERTAELEAANKELEAFTYSVSHDLRAPLRHINGFTRILVEEFGPSLPGEAQRHLQRIEQGANRMGRLVDELLNLARLGRQALTVEATGLSSLVQDVVTLLAPESEGRQVEWKIAALPFVECDPILIRQVFQNLIGNALKYSRPRSPAVIEIGETEKEGKKTIFVKDNGVGFSMKYADKLFGVFQRLHHSEDFEGTGVGLATVQRIIQKHGGQVWAEAELDQGATFYFTLGGRDHFASGNAAGAAGGQL